MRDDEAKARSGFSKRLWITRARRSGVEGTVADLSDGTVAKVWSGR